MTEHTSDQHDHGGVGKYLVVFAALLVLTSLSFIIANTPAIMSTPAVGWVLMMAVSCCKAILVITFFMHLKWEANWKYVLTVPASIMSAFLVLMLIPDIGFRTRNYSPQRWIHSTEVESSPMTAIGHDGPAASDASHGGEHGSDEETGAAAKGH